MHVLSVSLTDPTDLMDEVTLSTEALWTFREAGGLLYVPYVDPQGTDDGTTGQLAIRDSAGAWTVLTNVTPVPEHVGDVQVTPEGIFLFGSSFADGGGGSVWFSADDGATWTVSLAPRTYTGYFHAAWVIDGDLFTYLTTPDHGVLYRRPVGGPWEEVSDTPFVAVGETAPFDLDGAPFVLRLRNGKPDSLSEPGGLTVHAPSPTTVTAVEAALPPALAASYDVCATATALYVLALSGIIWRCDHTGTWSRYVQAGGTPVCFTVDEAGGYVYFGYDDSSVKRAPLPTG